MFIRTCPFENKKALRTKVDNLPNNKFNQLVHLYLKNFFLLNIIFLEPILHIPLISREKNIYLLGKSGITELKIPYTRNNLIGPASVGFTQ